MMNNLMNICMDVAWPGQELLSINSNIMVILVIVTLLAMIIIPGVVVAIIFGSKAHKRKVADALAKTAEATGKTGNE